MRVASGVGAASFAVIAMFLGCGDKAPDTVAPAVVDPPKDDAGAPPVDASSPDVAADGAIPATFVTVVATTVNGPAANVTVLFHDSSGEILEQKTTDVGGKATTTDSRTTQVTLVRVGAVTSLLSYIGVAAGDVLHPNVQLNGEEVAELGSVQVVFPPAASAGASVVLSYARCGPELANTSPALLPVNALCAGGPVASVFAVDEGSFSTISKVAAPALGATTNVTLPAWAAGVETTVEYEKTGLPSGFSMSGSVRWVGNGSELRLRNDFVAPTGMQSLRIPPASVDYGVLTDVLARAPVSPSGEEGYSVTRQHNAGPLKVAWAESLPRIKALSVTPVGARADVSWTTETAMPSVDGVEVDLIVGSPSDGTFWRVVVPPSVTTFRTPVLPASVAKTLSAFAITFFDDDAVAGYAAFKLGERGFGSGAFYPRTTLGADGARLRVARLQP